MAGSHELKEIKKQRSYHSNAYLSHFIGGFIGALFLAVGIVLYIMSYELRNIAIVIILIGALLIFLSAFLSKKHKGEYDVLGMREAKIKVRR